MRGFGREPISSTARAAIKKGMRSNIGWKPSGRSSATASRDDGSWRHSSSSLWPQGSRPALVQACSRSLFQARPGWCPTARVQRVHMVLPSLLHRSPLVEGHPCWSNCARRARPANSTLPPRGLSHVRPPGGRALREHRSSMGVLPTLRFHHFQSRIELVSAGRAADAVRLHAEFVRPDSHAATVRTPDEMDLLIIDRLVL